jgi:hypothetical protein
MAAPHPGRSGLIRFALTAAVLLGIGYAAWAPIVAFALPAVRGEIAALDDNISITSLETSREGTDRMIRLRANLSRPVYSEHGTIYPVGWLPQSRRGGYQIYLNAIGVLQAPVVLLIAVLGWPHRSFRELAVRIAYALPLLILLAAIDAPLELLGNFRHAALAGVGSHGIELLFSWDRFLEGGGNVALALAFAAAAISAARARTARASSEALAVAVDPAQT